MLDTKSIICVDPKPFIGRDGRCYATSDDVIQANMFWASVLYRKN